MPRPPPESLFHLCDSFTLTGDQRGATKGTSVCPLAQSSHRHRPCSRHPASTCTNSCHSSARRQRAWVTFSLAKVAPWNFVRQQIMTKKGMTWLQRERTSVQDGLILKGGAQQGTTGHCYHRQHLLLSSLSFPLAC